MGRPFFRPAHRDAAEPAIIKALRAVGASVWPISGKDVPDLIVGFKGQTWLLEVKTRGLEQVDKRDGRTYKRDGKVSAGQQAFQDSWKGGPVRVVYTPEEALYAIGAPVEGVLGPIPGFPMMPAALQQAIREHRICETKESQGHVVTPAYQKAQTAAVVPKTRAKHKRKE